MNLDRCSAAMTSDVRDKLAAHLLGHGAEEDLSFALWRPSTGLRRITALVVEPVLPRPGDRSVHGNASFTMGYALRAAVEEARQRDLGVAFLHSHPRGTGWQGMSQADKVAEARLANIARGHWPAAVRFDLGGRRPGLVGVYVGPGGRTRRVMLSVRIGAGRGGTSRGQLQSKGSSSTASREEPGGHRSRLGGHDSGRHSSASRRGRRGGKRRDAGR